MVALAALLAAALAVAPSSAPTPIALPPAECVATPIDGGASANGSGTSASGDGATPSGGGAPASGNGTTPSGGGAPASGNGTTPSGGGAPAGGNGATPRGDGASGSASDASGGAATGPAPATSAPAPEAPAHAAGQAAAEATRPKNAWFALPVIFWLPETKLGFGATGGLHFQLRGAPRPSSVFAAAVYTIGNQGSIDVAAEVYAPGGAFLSGRARVVYFPDVFYGIGPQTLTSQKEDFTRRGVEGVFLAELPIPGVPGLRAGPRLDLRAEDIVHVQPGQLTTGTIPGSSGYSAVAGGVSVTWDTRDNAFWTTRGSLVDAWYVYAPAALANNQGFGHGVLEYRYFLSLGRGRVLGFQVYTEGAHGVTPFTLLPKIGSTHFLRGIREGRYRDQLDWATQAELRAPIRGRFAAVAFVGIGDVAPSVSALTLAHPKIAGGAGLRFRLTDAGANIRADVAFSGAGPELYIVVLEAF